MLLFAIGSVILGVVQPYLYMKIISTLSLVDVNNFFEVGMLIMLTPIIFFCLLTGFYFLRRVEVIVNGVLSGIFFSIVTINNISHHFSIYWILFGAVCGLIFSQIGYILKTKFASRSKLLKTILLSIISITIPIVVILCNIVFMGIFKIPVRSIFERYECQIKGGTYGYNWSLNSDMCYIEGEPYPVKPVIYLYPKQTQLVNVKINYKPGFFVTYPLYRNGWTVIASPQGRIVDTYDKKEYSYLYWEGNSDSDANYDLSTGFVVKGEDTVAFLQNKLSEIGLIPKEYNEFIVYWYPKMKKNPYNLIHFASKLEYNDKAELNILPEPDSLLRVFMVFKPLSSFTFLNPQVIRSFTRQGFSVVEWGGSELP